MCVCVCIDQQFNADVSSSQLWPVAPLKAITVGHQPGTQRLARCKCHHYHAELAPRLRVWNLNCFPVFFGPRFFFSIPPPWLSPPRHPSLVALTRGSLWIFTRIGKPALRSARIVFLAPPVIGFLFFFFFYSPCCYSLFIQPTFSTRAAPILTVL